MVNVITWGMLLDALFDIYINQFSRLKKIWAYFDFDSKQFITDENYYIPSVSELNQFIDVWIKQYLPSMHYNYDVEDCDDFAMTFKVEAQRFFGYKYNGIGFAWGLLCYEGSCGGHAWNIVLLSDYGYGLDKYGFGIVFIEPQLGEILQIVEDKFLSIVSSDGFKYVYYGVII